MKIKSNKLATFDNLDKSASPTQNKHFYIKIKFKI